MDYLDAITRLPLPTAGQTVRFANHVVSSHSWYKHLPFFPPGKAFILYLNPRAGWGIRGNASGEKSEYSVYERELGENHALSTADYREQFGHWDYFCKGQENDPWTYRLWEGGQGWLPVEVIRRWSRQLTAFCRPGPTMHLLRYSPCQDDDLKRFKAFASERPADPDVVRYQPFVSRLEAEGVAAWADDRTMAFMETEAGFQRDRVLHALIAIRAEVGIDPALAFDPAFLNPRPGPPARAMAAMRRSGRALNIARRGSLTAEDFFAHLEAWCDKGGEDPPESKQSVDQGPPSPRGKQADNASAWTAIRRFFGKRSP